MLMRGGLVEDKVNVWCVCMRRSKYICLKKNIKTKIPLAFISELTIHLKWKPLSVSMYL